MQTVDTFPPFVLQQPVLFVRGWLVAHNVHISPGGKITTDEDNLEAKALYAALRNDYRTQCEAANITGDLRVLRDAILQVIGEIEGRAKPVARAQFDDFAFSVVMERTSRLSRFITNEALFKSYVAWCQDHDEVVHDKQWLGRQMRFSGFISEIIEVDGKTTRCWLVNKDCAIIAIPDDHPRNNWTEVEPGDDFLVVDRS